MHHRQRDCGAPLVLLASASRDRLVHVFDASLSSSGGARGGGARCAEAATEATASTSAFSASGGVTGGAVAAGQAREGGAAGLNGFDARFSFSGKAAAVNAGAGVGAGTAAETAAVAVAGFPLLKTLDSHSGSVTAVKFTKDGKRCVFSNVNQAHYL